VILDSTSSPSPDTVLARLRAAGPLVLGQEGFSVTAVPPATGAIAADAEHKSADGASEGRRIGRYRLVTGETTVPCRPRRRHRGRAAR
jgi:hypothetical protein